MERVIGSFVKIVDSDVTTINAALFFLLFFKIF